MLSSGRFVIKVYEPLTATTIEHEQRRVGNQAPVLIGLIFEKASY